MRNVKFDIAYVGRFNSELDLQIYIDILWNAMPEKRPDIEMFDYMVDHGFSYREASNIDPHGGEAAFIRSAMRYENLKNKGLVKA